MQIFNQPFLRNEEPMKIEQRLWTKNTGWTCHVPFATKSKPDLVLVFGATGPLDSDVLQEVRKQYPSAYICGCSTAGAIADDQVLKDWVATTAVAFENTKIHTSETPVQGPADSFQAGQKLASELPTQ